MAEPETQPIYPCS